MMSDVDGAVLDADSWSRQCTGRRRRVANELVRGRRNQVKTFPVWEHVLCCRLICEVEIACEHFYECIKVYIVHG